MSLLKVEDVHVYYGAIHAIKGISFEVNQGEIVTLIGANGAGKSTTLNTVVGLLRPRSGHIEFDGKSIVGFPAEQDGFTSAWRSVPEGRRVFQQMTVRENLEMGGYIQTGGGDSESMDDVFNRLSAPEGARKAGGRHACPAANSRCWRWAAR